MGRVLATIAVLLIAATPARAAPKRACSREGSRTVFETRHVRVYRWLDRYIRTERVFACLYSTGRPWSIGDVWEADDHSYSRVEVVVVRRQYIAYVLRDADIHEGPESAAVLVRDLRSGKIVHAYGRAGYAIHAVVMNRHGAVAWSGAGDEEGALPEIRRSDRGDRHASRLLDQGSALDMNSLALRGGRLEWRNGAESRSAPLP